MAARCVTKAFSTTCAVHIEDCEGWWLSGYCGSVAKHWRLKTEVSWVQLPVTAGFFTFLYFHLITSKFIYLQCNLVPSNIAGRSQLTGVMLLSQEMRTLPPHSVRHTS